VRVAIDARWLQPGREGGIGRGLANLLPHLRAEADVQLLTDARLPPAGVDLPQQPLRAPWPGRSSQWLQWSAPRWLRGFDGVFHCPFYALPFRQPVPMVVSIHDLTFEHHREWFRPGVAAAFRTQARHAARTARVVLTPSSYVRDDVVATYRIPPERVLVAPNAVDPSFSPDRAGSVSIEGIRAPYVVALGGAPRRNREVAVTAWRQACANDGLGLVVVGADDWPSGAGIVSTGRLDDTAWPAVLAGAAAFVYPTGDEGFGMPALESLAAGTPVVCGRVGALPEVLGDAASWAESTRVDDVAAALARVLRNPDLARDLRERGLARAAGWPTWADAAAVHLDAYSRAVASR
jgi:glycosyltransferase involved in cell wall biosynthesis